MLGGVRSGKSAYAEGLMRGFEPPYLYIATAQVFDQELGARVEQHKQRRGADWQTLEAPFDLAETLTKARQPVLVDCLSMWLTNLLLDDRDTEAATDEFCSALASAEAPIVLVSNEVGLGGISANALQRRFADSLGLLNQRVAGMSERVVLVAAGLPLTLKG